MWWICGKNSILALPFCYEFYNKKARGSPRARPILALILTVKLCYLHFYSFSNTTKALNAENCENCGKSVNLSILLKKKINKSVGKY